MQILWIGILARDDVGVPAKGYGLDGIPYVNSLIEERHQNFQAQPSRFKLGLAKFYLRDSAGRNVLV